jgi:hypothetical protein
MATASTKFRIDVGIQNLLQNSNGRKPIPVLPSINICRNNLEDVKMLTEYAHDHRIATDYHINETPMLEQDKHFKHLSENPTYFRPEDWRDLHRLVDWIIEKNKAGLSDGEFSAETRGDENIRAHVFRSRH